MGFPKGKGKKGYEALPDVKAWVVLVEPMEVSEERLLTV